jgi:RHS repeat-associated protein
MKAGAVHQRITYNSAKRPVAVYDINRQLLARYYYNTLGERIGKTVYESGRVTTVYSLYDAQRLSAETDADGRITAHYVYLYGKPVAKIEMVGAPAGQRVWNAISTMGGLLADERQDDNQRIGRVYPIHTDHLGTPQVVTDEQAKLVWQGSSNAFGKLRVTYAALSAQRKPFEMNLRLPGQVYDAETGLHQNYFRDYDPALGRYVTADPSGLVGGTNSYAYVGANPLNGHTFGADFMMAGISLNVEVNLRFAKLFPDIYSSASLDNRFVTLRNGTVDFARGKWTKEAIHFVTKWRGPREQTVGRPIDSSDGAIRYERNNYRFENLRVLAKQAAIVVEGSHTVIRNCVIESSANAAIFVAGDHVIIENCEIRLRKSGRGTVPKAAIVLRDGSHAVIRNNTIRIDYGRDAEDQTHCILVRDGATDVVVEGNTFVNVKGKPVTLTEGSTATVRGNHTEKRWF